MSSTSFSVQPVDLGAKLQKVNFGSERFQLEGYTTYHDIFAPKTAYNQGNNKKSDLSSGGGYDDVNGDGLSGLKDNSLCAARFVYALEYMGNEADPQKNLLAILTELYRICCDGALIEIRCANPLSEQRIADPLKQRSLNATTWVFFDRQQRQEHKDPLTGLSWAQDERMAVVLEALEQSAINFKLLRTQLHLAPSFMQRVKSGAFKSQQEVQNAINAYPQVVTATTFYLVCVKDESHSFAVANMPPCAPFAMRVYSNQTEDIYISQSINQTGAWEPNESHIALTVLQQMLASARYQQGLKVANIGANIGWYCLLVGKLSPKITIDAFEPTPKTLEILTQNLKINALNEQVTLYPCAISDSVGHSDLFINEHNAGGNALQFTESDHDFDRSHKVTITTETLDRLYAERAPEEWPDFIIIDTEGHEQKVWNGAQKLFAAGWRPAIMTEFAPTLLKLRGECNYYVDWIEKYHYQAYCITRTPNQVTLIPQTVADLNRLFDQLKDNTQGLYSDLLFVPDYFHFQDGVFVIEPKD